MNRHVIREAFIIIDTQYKNLIDKQSELIQNLKNTEKEIYRLQEIRLELRNQANICANCNGRGKVWITYAQDDIKMEACTGCAGTGLAKDLL